MTLELLICTLDEGINRLERSLLPQREDVRYLVSWQYSDEEPDTPQFLLEREDVRVVKQQGRGLSRNRNLAFEHAQGDVLKICDDDETWTNEYLDVILNAYRLHPEADLIHFRADGHNKVYPPNFITSFEITLRQEVARKVRFDERFGLGSPYLNAGEEEVFVYDVRRQHFIVLFLPYSITKVEGSTTGDNIREPRLQRSKGAVWYYTRGLSYALYKSVRESMGLMLRKRMNPIAVFRNMLWGINYIRRWQP
ncbi:MAG: glycosyltransferase [Bacteroidaceae bacterium]|nr:glycosyltransferase [Bacteroidaceae bacterium]